MATPIPRFRTPAPTPREPAFAPGVKIPDPAPDRAAIAEKPAFLGVKKKRPPREPLWSVALRTAQVPHCPHPPGRRLFARAAARHGTYARKTPSGMRIARLHVSEGHAGTCPESHTTLSLLPDCLAARLPGTLAELEDAVATAGDAASVAASDAARRAFGTGGAMRWLRRRIGS